MHTGLKVAGSIVIVGFGLGIMAASQTTPSAPPAPPPPPPRFQVFTVSPDVVCTNIGLPIVRVNWTVSGSEKTCVDIFVNGTKFPPPGTPYQRCDENNWSGEVTINLAQVFGSNIPSTISIEGRLTDFALTGVGPEFDREADTVTTRVDCQFGTTPGG